MLFLFSSWSELSVSSSLSVALRCFAMKRRRRHEERTKTTNAHRGDTRQQQQQNNRRQRERRLSMVYNRVCVVGMFVCCCLGSALSEWLRHFWLSESHCLARRTPKKQQHIKEHVNTFTRALQLGGIIVSIVRDTRSSSLLLPFLLSPLSLWVSRMRSSPSLVAVRILHVSIVACRNRHGHRSI